MLIPPNSAVVLLVQPRDTVFDMCVESLRVRELTMAAVSTPSHALSAAPNADVVVLDMRLAASGDRLNEPCEGLGIIADATLHNNPVGTNLKGVNHGHIDATNTDGRQH